MPTGRVPAWCSPSLRPLARLLVERPGLAISCPTARLRLSDSVTWPHQALAGEVCGWRAAFKETVRAAERTRQRQEAASGLAKLTNRLEALTGVDVDGDGDVNEKCLAEAEGRGRSLTLGSNVQSGQDSLGEASGRAQPKHGGAVGEAGERVRSSSSASGADEEPEEPAGGVEMGRLLLVHMLEPEDDGCRFEQVMAQTPRSTSSTTSSTRRSRCRGSTRQTTARPPSRCSRTRSSRRAPPHRPAGLGAARGGGPARGRAPSRSAGRWDGSCSGGGAARPCDGWPVAAGVRPSLSDTFSPYGRPQGGDCVCAGVGLSVGRAGCSPTCTGPVLAL